MHLQAWAALAVGFPAAAVIWTGWRTGIGPRFQAAHLPIFGMLVAAVLQYFFGVIDFFGVLAIDVALLMGAGVLLCIGDIWQRGRDGQVLDYLSIAFVAAAIASLPIQALQWLGIQLDSAFLMQTPSPRRPYANLAQPNLLADLYLLAIVGLSWLRYRWGNKNGLTLFLMLCLLWGIAITESKAGFVNVFVLGAWFLLRAENSKSRRVQSVLAGVLILFLLMVVLQRDIQSVFISSGGVDGGGVLQFSSNSSSARLNILSLMFVALQHSPLMGYGMGQGIKTNFVVDDTFGVARGFVSEGHNFFLDMLVWFGYPVGAVISMLFIIVCFRLLKKTSGVLSWHGQAMLLILAIHSLVEFPLHYAFYLFPCALVVGMLGGGGQIQRLALGDVNKYLFTGLFLGLLLVCVIFVRDYSLIEKSYYALRFESRGYQRAETAEPPDIWLLTQMEEHLRFSRASLRKSVEGKELAELERVVMNTPGAYLIHKLALQYALVGNGDRARFWLRQLCAKAMELHCAEAKEKWTAAALRHGVPSELVGWPIGAETAGDPAITSTR